MKETNNPKTESTLVGGYKMSCVCDNFYECPGWEKSYKRLRDAVIFYNKCFGGPYTGIQFKFCPFCGRPITEEMEKSRKIG